MRERLYVLYYRDPITRKFVSIEGAEVFLRINDETGEVRPTSVVAMSADEVSIPVRKPLSRRR